MKSYDKQNAISISYTYVTSGCQSRWPLWWSLMHWMDHPTVYDMIKGPLSFFLSILHQWKAVICRNPTVHHIYVQSQYVSKSSPSNDLQCIEWIIWLFVICRILTVTSVYQSMWPLQWSPVHWMDHLAACDMMRDPPSFLESILHEWKAVICEMSMKHHLYL